MNGYNFFHDNINYREAEDAMDYNLHPKTQRVQQLHEKKHLGHDPTTSCENVRYTYCDGLR